MEVAGQEKDTQRLRESNDKKNTPNLLSGKGCNERATCADEVRKINMNEGTSQHAVSVKSVW